MLDQDKLLKADAVCEMLGMGKTTLHYKLKKDSKYYDETFPKPIQLSANRIAFKESEINAWVASKAEARAA